MSCGRWDWSKMKKYKIWGIPWHCAHNYSLLNLPNTEWYYLQNNVRRWSIDARPLPDNVHWVSYYEPGKYDLAVLHVDQQCADPAIGKGVLYKHLNSVIQDIPKIVINHGTPVWPEKWISDGRHAWKLPPNMLEYVNGSWREKDKKEVREYQRQFLINGGKTYCDGKVLEIKGMKELIGDNTMVVNSYKAQEQWGWGEVIWHGLDKNDWWDLPKEPRAVMTLSPAGLDYYYNRRLLRDTQSALKEFYGLNLVQIGRDWNITDHPQMSEIGGWGAYRDTLGRSLIYVNTTKESPMPRARTEAMLSGCCVLSTPYQDADKFLSLDAKAIWSVSDGEKDFISKIDKFLTMEGITGIIIPDNPTAISALINHLINNRYKEAVKIGQTGKKKAQEIFSKERYDKQWSNLISKVIKEKK